MHGDYGRENGQSDFGRILRAELIVQMREIADILQ